MRVQIYNDTIAMSAAAACEGADCIRKVLSTRGEANIIVATGASQLQMLGELARQPDIRWDRIIAFHLDEYVGLPIEHSASFRKYLWERFHSKLPLPLRAFHYIDCERDTDDECRRVSDILRAHPVDVAFIGIGENGHIAFNDPPANFETVEPYLAVELDEACRRQQWGEGWFDSLDEVPRCAISMSVCQILKSSRIICTVPDKRKAQAVAQAVQGPVVNTMPASILQQHGNCTLYLDQTAASGLGQLSNQS